MAKKTTKRDLILTCIMSIILSVMCLYAYSLKGEPEITHNIKGIFNEYKRISGTKSSSHYYIYVNEMQYNIPSIYMGAFNTTEFSKNVAPGDSLQLEVTDNKSIYQISDLKHNYINTDKRIHDIEFNLNVALALGLTALLIAIITSFKYLKMF